MYSKFVLPNCNLLSYTVPLKGNVALAHILHTRHSYVRMLDTLNSITLKWYNMQELTHSKIQNKTKSKFKSLGTFTRELPYYAML